jgi:hypothetical protein
MCAPGSLKKEPTTENQQSRNFRTVSTHPSRPDIPIVTTHDRRLIVSYDTSWDDPTVVRIISSIPIRAYDPVDIILP